MAEFDKSSQQPAWCPGCGHFDVREAVIQALNNSGFKKKDLVMVSGIGQTAKMPHYLDVNFFNGLHGRALPAATGLKLATPKLQDLGERGEGCNYGEGGNHFLAAARRNINLALVVHNNQIYGLTKGQASPTTEPEQKTGSTPQGVLNQPFHPLSVAVVTGAGYVARGFSGEKDHLAGLIEGALRYPGFALVDVLTPCVSFNRTSNFQWYKSRVKMLPDSHDPADKMAALALTEEWGEEIPIGLIYRRHPDDHPPLEMKIASHRGLDEPLVLVGNPPRREALEALVKEAMV